MTRVCPGHRTSLAQAGDDGVVPRGEGNVSRSSQTPPHPDRASDDVLAAVLTMEQQLTERVAAARVEAEAVIAAARAAAEAAEGACAAAIETRTRELDAQYSASLRRDIATIAADADRAVAAYDAIGEARIRALAELAVARVLRVDGGDRRGAR